MTGDKIVCSLEIGRFSRHIFYFRSILVYDEFVASGSEYVSNVNMINELYDTTWKSFRHDFVELRSVIDRIGELFVLTV